MPESPSGNHWVDGIFTASAVVLLAFGWVKRVRPWWKAMRKDFTAARDAVVGRDAIIDPADGSIAKPALPGIGVRMAHQEQQMELLAITVTKLVDNQTHQLRLEARVEEHSKRLDKLEAHEVLQVVNKVENAQLYKAMETAIKATPDTEAEAED